VPNFSCPRCRQTLSVPAGAEGHVRCPACGQVLLLPGAPPPPLALPVDPPAPQPQVVSDVGLKGPAPARHRRLTPAALAVICGGVALLFLCCGIGVYWRGSRSGESSSSGRLGGLLGSAYADEETVVRRALVVTYGAGGVEFVRWGPHLSIGEDELPAYGRQLPGIQVGDVFVRVVYRIKDAEGTWVEIDSVSGVRGGRALPDMFNFPNGFGDRWREGLLGR
jgi:LSD1 subclass zinc finger protein